MNLLKDGKKHSYEELIEVLNVAGDTKPKSLGHSAATLTRRGLVARTTMLAPNGDKLKALQLTEKGIQALKVGIRIDEVEEKAP